MNKELVQRVIPLIDKMEEGIAKAVEVLQRECPLLVEDILQWNFAVSFIWFMVGVLILFSYLIYAKRCWRHAMKVYDHNNQEDGQLALMTMAGICHLVFGVTIMACSLTWVKIWIAPRLFLLEYVSELVGR